MNPTVSVFRTCAETIPAKHATLSQLVAAIRSPSQAVREICASLRVEKDKRRRHELKRGLPAITWGADLSTRGREIPIPDRELSRSGLICLDMDALPDLPLARASLQAAPHTLVVFLSPSGDGLKVLVPIAGPFESHWDALAPM